MSKIEDILKKVCIKNNLGELIFFERANEGMVSNSYILTTTMNKFFLKTYRGDFDINVHNIEKFMEGFGIPAINAIAVDMSEKSIIYPYVESDRSHNYEMSDYYTMGKMLANIHSASFGKVVLEKSGKFLYEEVKNNQSLVETKKYIDFIEKKDIKDDTDLLFLIYLQKKLQYSGSFINNEILPNDVLIHGDYHAGNLLFDKKTREIIGICDWDKSKYAPRTYDVARAYLYIGFSSGTEDLELCEEIGEKVLQGYRSVLPLSDEDLKKGIMINLKSYIYTSWLEENYYKLNNPRTNKFIKNKIKILDHFLK